MMLVDTFVPIAKTVAALALVALALGQVYRPWTRPARGTVIRRIRLSPWARVRLHSLWLLGTAILVGLAAMPQVTIGTVPLTILAVGMLLLAALPVHYTLTAEGITVGRTPLRRWTQFAGLSVRGDWIYLQPVAGRSGLLVRSPGGAEGKALVTEMRGLVRRSYKGDRTPDASVSSEPLVGGSAA